MHISLRYENTSHALLSAQLVHQAHPASSSAVSTNDCDNSHSRALNSQLPHLRLLNHFSNLCDLLIRQVHIQHSLILLQIPNILRPRNRNHILALPHHPRQHQLPHRESLRRRKRLQVAYVGLFYAYWWRSRDNWFSFVRGQKDLVSLASLLEPFPDKLLIVFICIGGIPEILVSLVGPIQDRETDLVGSGYSYHWLRPMRPNPMAPTSGAFLPSLRLESCRGMAASLSWYRLQLENVTKRVGWDKTRSKRERV